nr:DNA polymerase III subunit gamma/tau [Pseudarcicella sp.]
TCESCVSFQNNASFNIHELDAASNNSVDDIRSLIDQVRYPPHSGKYKIYIIDEVHMLSTSAFNAFLKTLEEPPSYAIFILATTEKHKILPTILSRCQIFDFNRIQVKDMSEHLANIAQKEGITAETEALDLIAQKADGGLRDALSMFDLNVTFSLDNVLRYSNVLENLHILDYDYYFKMTHSLIAGNISEVFLLFDEILKKGFDALQFVSGLSEHFRNLMVCKDPVTVTLLETSSSVQEKYLAQSSLASYSFLISSLSIGTSCELNFKSAKNQKLHVEVALLKMANITKVINLASLPAVEGGLVGKSERVHEQGESLVVVNTAVVENDKLKNEVLPNIEKPKPNIALGKLKSTVAVLKKEVVVEEVKAVKQNNFENKPFNKEQLLIYWNLFLKELEKKEKHSEFVIFNREFQLEGTRIHLYVDHEIQADLLQNSLRTELLTFLRNSLENSDISLDVSVQEVMPSNLVYTQAEKFNFLTELNPHLAQLRVLLGLEYDF